MITAQTPRHNPRAPSFNTEKCRRSDRPLRSQFSFSSTPHPKISTWKIPTTCHRLSMPSCPTIPSNSRRSSRCEDGVRSNGKRRINPTTHQRWQERVMIAILRRPHHLAALRSCLKFPWDPGEGVEKSWWEEEEKDQATTGRCRGVYRGTQSLPRSRKKLKKKEKDTKVNKTAF